MKGLSIWTAVIAAAHEHQIFQELHRVQDVDHSTRPCSFAIVIGTGTEKMSEAQCALKNLFLKRLFVKVHTQQTIRLYTRRETWIGQAKMKQWNGKRNQRILLAEN